MIVYFNGEFMPKEEVCVSPDDRGFLFGDGVYEVFLVCKGQIFEAEAHFARLAYSLDGLTIPAPDMDELRDALDVLIERNELTDQNAKLYVQITRGVAPRDHAYPDAPIRPTVYASATPTTLRIQEWASGVQAILVPDIRWTRCDIKSLCLLPNIMASQQAKEAGAYEAIFVREGVITEGSHTTICAVFDGTLITHPLTQHILGGVTRQVVLRLCRELEIPYEERAIPAAGLEIADELMVLGTTTGVMPVTLVDGLKIGDGQPGPVTRQLQAALGELLDTVC